jgi:pimeloyl-ACP methyl ester carboxylesterase
MPRLSRRRFLAGTGVALIAGGAAAMTPPLRAETSADTIRVGGVPIHFERSGRGRPVVLIHGASGNLNDMTFRLAPRLAASHEVVALDRPGHGESGLPPGGGASIRTQAALLRATVAALGIERPIVVGHSYGGSVALAWAVDAPEALSGLVLLAAPSQVWEGGLGLSTDLLASPATGPVLARAVSHLATRGFAERTLDGVFAPQAPPDGYLEHLDLSLVLQPASLRENARQLAALKEELRPMVPAYPALDLPVAIVHGEADRTVGLEIHSVPLARQIPGARLARLPGIGHMLHQVATDAAVAAVQQVT